MGEKMSLGTAVKWGVCVGLAVTGLAACSQSDTKPASNQDTSRPVSVTAITEKQATPSSALSDKNTATANVGNNMANNKASQGEAVYQQTCRVCHDTGALNAPKIGDKSVWQARIAQGKETLYAHAIGGFTGKLGTMPPKGGSAASDSEVQVAVDYMVEKSR